MPTIKKPRPTSEVDVVTEPVAGSVLPVGLNGMVDAPVRGRVMSDGLKTNVVVGWPTPPPVSVVVVTAPPGVVVVVEAGSSVDGTQLGAVNTLLSSVTAPLRASARP